MPRRKLVGAAVGLPSPIDPETGAVDPEVLETWASRRAGEIFSQRLGTSVAIENDANLEAMGELSLGAGRGMRDAIYVHVGWGIGGAVVLGGRLRRGITGLAGEFAHIRVRGADGPVCHCGRRGCLKSVASGYALQQDLAVAQGGDLALEDLLALARDGDPASGARSPTPARRSVRSSPASARR